MRTAPSDAHVDPRSGRTSEVSGHRKFPPDGPAKGSDRHRRQQWHRARRSVVSSSPRAATWCSPPARGAAGARPPSASARARWSRDVADPRPSPPWSPRQPGRPVGSTWSCTPPASMAGTFVRKESLADVRPRAAHQPHLGLHRRPRRAPVDGGRRTVRVRVLELVARTAARALGVLRLEGGAQRLRRGDGRRGRT